MNKRLTWSIRHSQIKNFAALDEIVEGLHDLRDGGRIIPPMEIKQVDIICTEFLERFLDLHSGVVMSGFRPTPRLRATPKTASGATHRMLQTFLVIALIVDSDALERSLLPVKRVGGVLAVDGGL